MESRSLHTEAAGPVVLAPAKRDDARLLPQSWERALRTLAIAGVALTVVGWTVAAERTCPSLLLGSVYALGIGLGGLLFIAFGYITGAGWHVALRRVPEAMTATLPVTAILMVAALAGFPVLYEWSHADAVAADPLLQGKAPWLNTSAFMARAVVCLGVWILFAAALRRNSRRQDETGRIELTARNRVLSVLFLIAFIVTFSVASIDWLMSLEPHWYSTVFAVYHFAGIFVSGLATLTIVLIVLRRLGPLASVLRPDHLHDIGKLTFGFATFWGYIWFCQYMLIWYGNIPEETAHFVLRHEGAWEPLFALNPIVNWLIPFLLLLPRSAKRSESVMLGVALLLLAGHALDLYLAILPPFAGPRLGLWEIGPVVGALSLTALALFRMLGRAPLVPRGDPMLTESLHHET